MSASKVAVVVGVGPGNGSALARKFSAEGFAVALLARSTDYTEALSKTLDGESLALSCDVTDEAQIIGAFSEIEAQLGPIDVLLYNAGSGTWVGPREATLPQLEQSWRVNAAGLLLCAQQVMDGMVERGHGTILVTGATASLRGKPFTTVFAQAKAAQRSLAQSLARELGPEGVHVALVIVDGMIDLPSTREQMPEKSDEDFLSPDDRFERIFCRE